MAIEGPITQPHFDLPLRYFNGIAVTVQQDTLDDVVNCVEAAVRTEAGTRAWVPEFGIDDDTFENQPLDLGKMHQQLQNSEPRAVLDLDQEMSSVDNLAAKIVVGVNYA